MTAEFPVLIDGSFRSVSEKLLQLGDGQLDGSDRVSGRSRSSAPAASMASRTPAALWLEKLSSITTMSPVFKAVLFDQVRNSGSVDGALDCERRGESFRTQCPEERVGLPAPSRRLFQQPGAER